MFDYLLDAPVGCVIDEAELCLWCGEVIERSREALFELLKCGVHGSGEAKGTLERMVEGLRFLWRATKGYRLRPWRSPYLRWRLETYSGKKAETVQLKDFWALAWREKQQAMRFLRWVGEMRGYAEERGGE